MTPEFSKVVWKFHHGLSSISVHGKPLSSGHSPQSLPRLSHFLVPAETWCWGPWGSTWEGTWDVTTPHAQARPHCSRFPLQTSNSWWPEAPSASPFLKGLELTNYGHLEQKVRLRQSELSLCFAEKVGLPSMVSWHIQRIGSSTGWCEVTRRGTQGSSPTGQAYVVWARTVRLPEGLSQSLRVGGRTGPGILVSEPFIDLGGEGTSEDDPQALCKLLACPHFRWHWGSSVFNLSFLD